MHLTKKNHTWYAVVGYTDEYGSYKRKWIPGSTKKEAENNGFEFLHNYKAGNIIEEKDMTLEKYLEEWLKMKDKLAPESVRVYNSTLNMHVIPELGKLKLANLTPMRIQKLYNKLRLKGENIDLYVHRILHSALEDAKRKWKLIANNPADNAEISKIKERENYTVWTPDQMAVFINACTEDEKLSLAFAIISSTGLRRAETLGLKWENIDFENDIIQVRQQLQRVNGKLTLRGLKQPKSRRDIPIVYPELIQILKLHKKEQLENRIKFGPNYDNSIPGIVVTWKDGRPVDPQIILSSFKRLSKKHGLPVIRIHDLRHSFITELILKGVDFKTVQELAGHSKINITLDIYGHSSIEDKRKKMSLLENPFRIPK